MARTRNRYDEVFQALRRPAYPDYLVHYVIDVFGDTPVGYLSGASRKAAVLEADLDLHYSPEREAVEQVLGGPILDNLMIGRSPTGIASVWRYLKGNPYLTKDALLALGNEVVRTPCIPATTYIVHLNRIADHALDQGTFEVSKDVGSWNGWVIGASATRKTPASDDRPFKQFHQFQRPFKQFQVLWDPNLLEDLAVDSQEGMDSLVAYVKSVRDLSAVRSMTRDGVLPESYQLPAVWNLNDHRMPTAQELRTPILGTSTATHDDPKNMKLLKIVAGNLFGTIYASLLGHDATLRMQQAQVPPLAVLEAPTALRHGWTADEWVDLSIAVASVQHTLHHTALSLLTAASVDRRVERLVHELPRVGREMLPREGFTNCVSSRAMSCTDVVLKADIPLRGAQQVEGAINALGLQGAEDLSDKDCRTVLLMAREMSTGGTSKWTLPTFRRIARQMEDDIQRALLVKWYIHYRSLEHSPSILESEDQVVEFIRTGTPLSWALKFLGSQDA